MRSRRKATTKRFARKTDARQMDLLDWLDAQPSFAPTKSRLKAVSAAEEVDLDQLDIEELIASVSRAA